MEIIEIRSDADFEKALNDINRPQRESDAGRGDDDKPGAVRAVVDAVAQRGDDALVEYTKRFDGVDLAPAQFEVDRDEIEKASAEIEPELLGALKRAHDNILKFHERNLRQSWEDVSDDGTVLGQRITPIESVGLYVPGGTAFYPSSVLMNIVPARVAGVREIVMVSPPSFNGTIHPLVLAASRIAGATRVFRIGGAQAIAALAYGTNTVPQVLKIAGPGNIYVTLAKRLVSTICDIDKEAGPSEVVVIADDSATPALVAAELLAQAEHDEESVAILVATSREKVAAVQDEVERQTETLPRAAIVRAALAGQGKAYVVRTLDDATRIANAIAPEHLSIQTEDPRNVFDRIQNVGCAILGGGTSIAVGDYYAGPNHILPTGQRARFASPLTAEDFRKVTSVIAFSKQRMAEVADDVILLARAEKLDAHARAVELRK